MMGAYFRDSGRTKMVLPDIEITIQSYFESTDVVINSSKTIRDVKAMVCKARAIPVSKQIYFFRGLRALDNQTLHDIKVEDGSTIKMSVQSRFIERVHPFNLRDPFTGLLPVHPIACSDGYSYEKTSLEQWQEYLQRQRMKSPMSGKFMTIGELNAPLKAAVEAHIRDIDEGIAQEEFLSLDSLGRTFNILGHFKDIVGRIPRRKRPRIVCLGNESIGKSAEMERLTFLCLFPRGEERCTRVAVEVRCHRGPVTNPVFRVISGRGMGTESDEDEDARENGRDCSLRVVVPVQKGAEEMQTQMSNVMDRLTAAYASPDLAPEVCMDRYIVLDITGPTLPDVTFVDFPGLAANDRDLLVEMLTREFEKFGENSIYLHMTKASEFTEDGPYAILQGFADGKLLNRTVGVVTQMDLADSIPDQPDRARQLIDLALGEKTADRDQLFPCGTFLVMNKDQMNDPPSGFESVYLRAGREKEFLEHSGFSSPDSLVGNVAGSNALIQQLHRMYFAQLVSTLIPQVIDRLQQRHTVLNRQEKDLGRLAVVYPPSEAQLLPLRLQITTGIIATLQAKLPALLLKFDREHVEPLESDLSDVLTPTRYIPKLDVDENIRQAYQDILTCFADRRETHTAFWLDELQMALNEDGSEVKLGRFSSLIDALKISIEAKLDAFYAMLQERFDEAFDVKDVTDKFSCVVRADRSESFEVPMVQLSFNIDAVTLAHTMCDSMRIFAEAIGNAEYIGEVLRPSLLEEGCSLVESCRHDRFNIWNERRLLHEATTDLLDMAYGFNNTGCVLCPGRLVSLCHANSSSLLELANGTCTQFKCSQYVTDLNSYAVQGSAHLLEGHDGTRFQVVDADNGEVAFYCPATSQFLCVEGGAVVSRAVANPADISANLPPEALFRAEFQPPPDSVAAQASSALSLCNIHSNSFITVTPAELGDASLLTAVPANSDGLTADAVFLVMGNPAE